jgi:peroxiredoxin
MPQHLQNGQPFPKLEVPPVGGGSLNLPSDLAGSYGVILIYRGHWCPFCDEQMAAFVSVSEKLSEEGIRFLGRNFIVGRERDDFASRARFMRGREATIAHCITRSAAL